MKNNISAIRLLCVLVIAAGIYFRVMPLEEKISLTQASSAALLQQTITDERALQDEPRIRLLAQKIRNDLKGLRIRSSANGDTNQALLGDLQTTATRNHLIVTAVKPDFNGNTQSVNGATMPQSDAPKQSETLADPKRTRDLDISVRGSYHDIVFFLRDLSHMPTLTRVLAVQLDRRNEDTSTSPYLDAAAHIQTVSLDRSLIP